MRRIAHLAAFAAIASIGAGAMAARVAGVSPQGEVAEVRQVLVRFAEAVVPAGELRQPAPFELDCGGTKPVGTARWLDERRWAFDLAEPLAAGSRCTLAASASFKPLGGAVIDGPTSYAFSTGAPFVVQARPYSGAPIEEDQHFLLRLNGRVDAASVAANVWCEIEGLLDRVPVRIVDGAPREALLKQQRGERVPAERQVLLACQRPLPAGMRVRLVWSGKRVQRFEWKVRPRLTAEFSCERENAGAPCLPLKAMRLRFSAPVPRALALGARLVPERGEPIAPKADDDERGETLQQLRFAAPLPENTKFRLTLTAELKDDAGRALANANSFPLAVATGGLPPLAKFAGAPFGIVEAGPEAMMPMTLRHVQADLAGASTAGRVSIKRLDASTPDAELMRWLARLREDHERQFETRKKPLIAAEPGATRTELPQLKDTQPGATEVIGIPLPQRGLHLVEVESRILGDALLEKRGPMYARTAALATNLGVHFKRGRSSSLVWVTTLDRGRGVAGARVVVNDCAGRPLWQGTTGADGIARIERGFENEHDEKRCIGREGLFVSARPASNDDLAFVFADWARGIEPWRFNIPTAGGPATDQRAHTVFDRTLLRVGETVSMKHFLREETEAGLALPPADGLPNEVLLTHVATDTPFKLPLAWPRGARSAESRWAIPKTAPLGLYDVTLLRGERRWSAGGFRVEAFRVPLVDARLSGPAGVQVAPREMAFSAQLNAMAGGPMPNAPLQLSALLRRSAVQFAGYDDFVFDPPRQRQGGGGSAEDEAADEGQRLVADKIAASTDKAGAARIVVPKLPAVMAPSELIAELGFDDTNGERQTVSQRLRLLPAGLLVGIRLPGWAASRGEAGLTAVVLTPEGKPLAGRAVEVQGRLHRTISTRKRIVGGFYAYDNRDEVQELGTLCSGTSDAQGRVACSLKLEQSGEVELVARAKDDAGRTAEAASSLWVSGRDEWWFAQDNDDRIDVLPEKREVQPGETARLQVRMPFRQATALVTVEREGVVDARVLTLTGREPVVEVPIPEVAKGAKSAKSWAPNVVVSVMVLRGRLRDAPWWSLFTWGWRDIGDWWRAFRYEGKDWRAPSAMVDLAKPSFKLGVAQLSVGLAEHRLEVKVTPSKTEARVRETVPATVQVSYGGKPAAGAEIAFAAVDEGLLALQANRSWDLLEGLMQPRPWGVETSTAQGEIVGRRHYGRKALPPGGGGGRNPTRELFDTLLLWKGTVVLDAKGQARIEVPMNDSLTSFRLVAIADAGADRFGTGSAVVRVSQELQMLPGLPPLVREGDRFDAAFTLRNTTARTLTLKAMLAGKVMGNDMSPIELQAQTVTLAAGAAQELRWSVTVPVGATRIDWEGEAAETAGSAPLRDRVKLAQAVLPAVPRRVWQASLQPLEGTLTLPLATPADALPGGQIVAGLQPKLSGALPGLRRYFQAYPYSCLEQRTSRSLGLRDPALWATLRDELPGYLDADGLASYFPVQAGSAPRGSDRLTAYLVSAAHEAGESWPDAARDAMLGALAAFVEGRLERRFTSPRADLEMRKLAALDALSRHGRVVPKMLDSIAWNPAAWPSSSLLDAWGIYRRSANLPDRIARIDELQRLLRSRLVAGGTTLKFSTEADDDWWWLMDGPDANAARLVLAAIETPAWKDELPGIVNGTLARQRGGAWLTTTANLWGVLALEKFGAKLESVPVAGRTTVQLAQATRAQDWKAAPEGGTLGLPWPVGSSTLNVQHEGSGRPWLTLQALAAVPLREPVAAGYRVTRSVSAVERKRPDAWSRGDVLRVRLEVEALADMAWVVVSDPVPAGASLLGGGLGRDSAIATRGEKREGYAWPAYEERGAEAWRGYYEWMPRGRHVVEYTLRLNASGRFALPPTRVEAMYAPESFGERPNGAIEVQP